MRSAQLISGQGCQIKEIKMEQAQDGAGAVNNTSFLRHEQAPPGDHLETLRAQNLSIVHQSRRDALG